jgi:hypothetical protein
MPNRQRKRINIETTKKNCTKPTWQYGITKYVCREKQFTPNYKSIKINGKNSQCQKTILLTMDRGTV